MKPDEIELFEEGLIDHLQDYEDNWPPDTSDGVERVLRKAGLMADRAIAPYFMALAMGPRSPLGHIETSRFARRYCSLAGLQESDSE